MEKFWNLSKSQEQEEAEEEEEQQQLINFKDRETYSRSKNKTENAFQCFNAENV